MTSLFEKARVAVLGKMHSLLDEVANTPDAYKQRIRDLEAALADLRAAGDEAAGDCNGYLREITNDTGKIARKQADIDLLLGDDDPSNDNAALTLQMEIEGDTTQLATLQSLADSAATNKAALDGAIEKLQAKHREMVNGLNQITLSAAATKAQNRASAAAEAALEASNSADGASIDSIQAKINHDRDVSDARFGRVIGDLQNSSSPGEAAAMARAKAAIEARRAEIAAKAGKGVQDAAPASA